MAGRLRTVHFYDLKGFYVAPPFRVASASQRRISQRPLCECSSNSRHNFALRLARNTRHGSRTTDHSTPVTSLPAGGTVCLLFACRPQQAKHRSSNVFRNWATCFIFGFPLISFSGYSQSSGPARFALQVWGIQRSAGIRVLSEVGCPDEVLQNFSCLESFGRGSS